MLLWWRKKSPKVAAVPAEARLREKYATFRTLLSLNNECLESMASLQEDLQYAPALRDIVGDRVVSIFDRAQRTVESLEKLTSNSYGSLSRSLRQQRHEVETYIAAQQESTTPRLSTWLSKVDASAAAEVGGKAAALGEVKNRLGLPVPEGYILTTEAYRQFCGIPLWQQIREALRRVDLSDLGKLQSVSAQLMDMVMARPLPHALEVAITERARVLTEGGDTLAVRSSAVGEGGARSFAGQFLSLINVLPEAAADAYKRVIAGRFGGRAVSYRLSTGLAEVESPMAVLFLPLVKARASGILYTRDPKQPRSDLQFLTSTKGLGLEIASGRMPADLFVISHKRPHRLLERHVTKKEEVVVPEKQGGVTSIRLSGAEAGEPSLEPEHLETLGDWGLRIEQHFGAPQDIEWVVDGFGKVWILQARPLILAEGEPSRGRARGEPVVAGGITVYPGRVSGAAFLAHDRKSLHNTPPGTIVIIPRASPEIVGILPRIVGLAAERGNITGHAATLLREFKVPSVFQMDGAHQRFKNGEPVSLDAGQPALYRGTLWAMRPGETGEMERQRDRTGDPLSRRLLTLNLLDSNSFKFRPGGCQSAHDVLRYCHEKAVEGMFDIQDMELEHGPHRSKKLLASIPVNLFVLDLGGGLAMDDPEEATVTSSQIISRPFQGLWKGITHPAVSWTREMPASFGDLASVMAGSFASRNSVIRALGERSYLLVANEYINLNSRLAYHFSLVDACLSDNASNNYISFRFAGGGAVRQRRNLRACFLEACLTHYGFVVDRRGDLVNAWFKRARAEDTEANLDMLGRLMACSCQLDMYMSGHEVMEWYVTQFLEGNYSFGLTPRETSDEGKP